MNMLAGTWTGGGLQIDGSDVVLPMPRSAAAIATKTILGIRPESLTMEETGHPFPLLVDVSELTGPELIVTGRVGSQKVVASLSTRQKVKPGEMVVLRLASDQIHLFDSDTGQRVRDDHLH